MSSRPNDRVKAVVMDVDGTLAGSDHLVNERTRRAVSRLHTVGLAGIILTGRSERAALAIARDCQLGAPVISAGGSITTDPSTGERIRVASWVPSRVVRILEVTGACGGQPLLWTVDHVYAEKPSSYTDALYPQIGERVRIAKFADLVSREPIVKVLVVGPPHLLDGFGARLEKLIPEFKRSMPVFYDASPQGSSKIEALDRVLSRLGLRREQCLGFGDGDTDIEWMAHLGHSVAVANASAGVRAIAAEVIGHHDEDAVARYLEEAVLPH